MKKSVKWWFKLIKKVKRFFLEIKIANKQSPKLDISDKIKIDLDSNKDFQVNKFFYKQIGIDHYWRDRLVWTDKEWHRYVKKSNFETWIMKKEDKLLGFYEQEYHPSSNEVELINMGILKEFRGKKLGSMLLNHSISSAFEKKPKRLWVHTCSLDHEYALYNYKSKGFKVFKEEEIDFVA